MSNGNANGLFQKAPNGYQYGPGGILQNVSSQPGLSKRISVSPGPSIPGDSVLHLITWTGYTTTSDTIGNKLEFDSSVVNLTNRFSSNIVMSVGVYVALPAAVIKAVTWTLQLAQNSTGIVFSENTEIQPNDSTPHFIAINAVVFANPGQQFRLYLYQDSGAAIIPTSMTMFIAMIGSS